MFRLNHLKLSNVIDNLYFGRVAQSEAGLRRAVCYFQLNN